MTKLLRAPAAAILLLLAAAPTNAQAPQRPRAEITEAALGRMQTLVKGPACAKAKAQLASDYDRTIGELIKITDTRADGSRSRHLSAKVWLLSKPSLGSRWLAACIMRWAGSSAFGWRGDGGAGACTACGDGPADQIAALQMQLGGAREGAARLAPLERAVAAAGDDPRVGIISATALAASVTELERFRSSRQFTASMA